MDGGGVVGGVDGAGAGKVEEGPRSGEREAGGDDGLEMGGEGGCRD